MERFQPAAKNLVLSGSRRRPAACFAAPGPVQLAQDSGKPEAQFDQPVEKANPETWPRATYISALYSYSYGVDLSSVGAACIAELDGYQKNSKSGNRQGRIWRRDS